MSDGLVPTLTAAENKRNPLIILENRDRLPPRCVGWFDVKVHVPWLASSALPTGQIEGVIRSANHHGISAPFPNLDLGLPFGSVIRAHRTPVSKRMMVRVINDVKVSETVYCQRRTAVIVVCLTERICRRPLVRFSIQRPRAHPKPFSN